jgi:NCAIR mutase (PurE)-related protein
MKRLGGQKMDCEDVRKLLEAVKNDEIEIEAAVEKIRDLPFKDLGFAMIDNHREIRVGYPEAIYCEGKTVEQVKTIVEFMLTKENNILATRANCAMYDAVKGICSEARYNELGRVITIQKKEPVLTGTYIAIVCAGTSDLPVVEEAAEVARILGNRVETVTDVGVAGIHRLFAKIDVIRGAKAVIVVAGMEGALASVIAGLVDKPVIAVPTSVGYGASFGGVSALLCMLNSCASGVSVVNIDNGFGAAYTASMINKLK